MRARDQVQTWVFVVGYLGMPRRYHAYPPEFQVLNVLSTAGASVLAVGYALLMEWAASRGRIELITPDVRMFAPQPEILEYLRRTARRHTMPRAR